MSVVDNGRPGLRAQVATASWLVLALACVLATPGARTAEPPAGESTAPTAEPVAAPAEPPTTPASASEDQPAPPARPPRVRPASRRRPAATAKPEAPPTFKARSFAIEQSSEGRAVVDLERPGVDPRAASLATLRVIDGRGVRLAKRVAIRKQCSSACGDANAAESCHVVGDYEFSGRSLEQFALAFDAATDVRVHPLVRIPQPRAAQVKVLAHVFKKLYPVPENTYGARWVLFPPVQDWFEQATHWERGPDGHPHAIETPTGARFSGCSLGAYGAVTEINCPNRRSVYVDNRFLGMSDDFELGPAVRYSADVDGVLMYVVLLKENNTTHPVILYRPKKDEWYKTDASLAHGAC